VARRPGKAIYIARAEAEIPTLLREQGAAVRREIEARLGDRTNYPVQPHILTTALQNLLARKEIVLSGPTKTRGGREIDVYHLPIVHDVNKGQVEDAAARKRLLQTRFLSWAVSSSKYPLGLIGPAGNRALDMAMKSSDLTGRFALMRGDGKDVAHVFGDPVPGGPLDSAAFVVGTRGGVAVRPVTVLFEVKNIRHWIYPSSWEVYQVLHKAAAIQQAHPDEFIVPVLICRRRHFWTRAMGVDLGFFVIEVHEQYVLPSTTIGDAEFEEVREGLGYQTLVRLGADAPARLVQSLRDGFLPYVLETAERWKTHGSGLVAHYEKLRDPNLRRTARSNAFADFSFDAAVLDDMALDWQPEQDDPFILDDEE
jgi:hypothetical protein